MAAKNLASRSQKGKGSSRKRKTNRKENGRPQKKKARKTLHPIKETLTKWKERHLPRDALQHEGVAQAEVATFEDDATLLALSENEMERMLEKGATIEARRGLVDVRAEFHLGKMCHALLLKHGKRGWLKVACEALMWDVSNANQKNFLRARLLYQDLGQHSLFQCLTVPVSWLREHRAAIIEFLRKDAEEDRFWRGTLTGSAEGEVDEGTRALGERRRSGKTKPWLAAEEKVRAQQELEKGSGLSEEGDEAVDGEEEARMERVEEEGDTDQATGSLNLQPADVEGHEEGLWKSNWGQDFEAPFLELVEGENGTSKSLL